MAKVYASLNLITPYKDLVVQRRGFCGRFPTGQGRDGELTKPKLLGWGGGKKLPRKGFLWCDWSRNEGPRDPQQDQAGLTVHGLGRCTESCCSVHASC